MSKISKKECAFIAELRKAGALQDVNKHLVDQSNGVILITCSDGDRFPDIFEYQVAMQSGQRSDSRIHVFAWHGGAIACTPCSPINSIKHADRIFLDQIRVAREMKGINTVALYAHAPCGAAAANDVDLEKVIALLIRAKTKIKSLNKGIEVFPFFHVDYGDCRKRTYFLSRPHWENWARIAGISAIA